MSDIEKKRKLAEEWAQHIETVLGDHDVISTDQVETFASAREVDRPFDGEFRHVFYSPLYRAGYRKMRRGDYVRTEHVTKLEQKPQCALRHMSNAEVLPTAPTSRSLFQFNGMNIRSRDEMLSLTDMWKAAGADPAKQPANWAALPSTKEFANCLETLIPGISRSELFHVVRGGNDPGTWAHWQIAMAYAKYLSSEFHAWCNEVVRAHMSSHVARPVESVLLPPSSSQVLPSIITEILDRSERRSERHTERMFERFMLMTKDLVAQILGQRETAPAPNSQSAPPSEGTSSATDQSCGPLGPVGPDGSVEFDIKKKIPANHFSSHDFLMAKGMYSKAMAYRLGGACKSLSVQAGIPFIKRPKWFGNKLRDENYWRIDILNKALRALKASAA